MVLQKPLILFNVAAVEAFSINQITVETKGLLEGKLGTNQPSKIELMWDIEIFISLPPPPSSLPHPRFLSPVCPHTAWLDIAGKGSDGLGRQTDSSPSWRLMQRGRWERERGRTVRLTIMLLIADGDLPQEMNPPHSQTASQIWTATRKEGRRREIGTKHCFINILWPWTNSGLFVVERLGAVSLAVWQSGDSQVVWLVTVRLVLLEKGEG